MVKVLRIPLSAPPQKKTTKKTPKHFIKDIEVLRGLNHSVLHPNFIKQSNTLILNSFVRKKKI